MLKGFGKSWQRRFGGGAAAAAGIELGGCRLLRPLGQGGGSEVWQALDLATGEAVAFKRLRAQPRHPGEAGLEAHQRFLREAAVLQRLAHPDILRLHRFGVTDGRPWMVTDLVAGGDLSQHTRPGALLPPLQAAALGARLARALHHAHAQGVVHRDLKPANVLIDLPRGVLRLADFGLARLGDASVTRTGLALGSPSYCAPEQLAGGELSAASDIYALGVLLFELLAGRLPFESGSLGALLQQVAHQPAPDLDRLCPGLPPGLAATVAACLQKQPVLRPAHALALANALEVSAGAGPPSG